MYLAEPEMAFRPPGTRRMKWHLRRHSDDGFTVCGINLALTPDVEEGLLVGVRQGDLCSNCQGPLVSKDLRRKGKVGEKMVENEDVECVEPSRADLAWFKAETCPACGGWHSLEECDWELVETKYMIEREEKAYDHSG